MCACEEASCLWNTKTIANTHHLRMARILFARQCADCNSIMKETQTHSRTLVRQCNALSYLFVCPSIRAVLAATANAIALLCMCNNNNIININIICSSSCIIERTFWTISFYPLTSHVHFVSLLRSLCVYHPFYVVCSAFWMQTYVDGSTGCHVHYCCIFMYLEFLWSILENQKIVSKKK